MKRYTSHVSQCVLKHLRVSDHPVCGTSVASRLFYLCRSHPSSRGGESCGSIRDRNSEKPYLVLPECADCINANGAERRHAHGDYCHGGKHAAVSLAKTSPRNAEKLQTKDLAARTE
jgi:hypothetical protein